MMLYFSLTYCVLLQLDIMEPKVPEDIYKTHLEHASESGPSNYACSLSSLYVVIYSPHIIPWPPACTQGSAQPTQWTQLVLISLHRSSTVLSMPASVRTNCWLLMATSGSTRTKE